MREAHRAAERALSQSELLVTLRRGTNKNIHCVALSVRVLPLRDAEGRIRVRVVAREARPPRAAAHTVRAPRSAAYASQAQQR